MDKTVCKKCGKEFDKGYTICPYCGAKHIEKKQKGMAANAILRAFAVLSVVLVLVCVGLEAAGVFKLFRRADDGDVPEQDAAPTNTEEAGTLAELAKLGIPYTVTGFVPSDGARGEIVSIERNEDDGTISVVISSGLPVFSARDWLYCDIADVEAELAGQFGIGEDEIHIEYVYSEFLREGLVIGQYKGSERGPLVPGDEDYLGALCFEVVTRDSSCENKLDEEEFLQKIEMDMSAGEQALTARDEFAPEGGSVASAIRLGYLKSSQGGEELCPYVLRVIYEERDNTAVSSVEDDGQGMGLVVCEPLPEQLVMPNTAGMDAEEAREYLEQRGIAPELVVMRRDASLPVVPGCVTASVPEAGAKIERGSKVVLFVSQ